VDPSEAIAIIETDLRELAKVVLTSARGGDWLQSTLDPAEIDELQGRLEEERKRRTPAVVPDELIAYTHIYELRKIIEKNWQFFAVALGEKKTFVVFMDKVEDYRNAPSHSRELLPHERSLLEGIAGEIRSRATAYRSSQAPDASYYPVIESIRDGFGNTPDRLSTEVATTTEVGVRLRPGQVLRFECRGWDPQGRELIWRIGRVFASYAKGDPARGPSVVL
jgi:hypothetical protein